MADFVDGSFSALARAGGRLPAAQPNRHGIERLVGLAYGERPEHRLDVYRPAQRTGALPVVVYFHGGAFRALSKDTHWLMGLAFARRGYLVLSANYRLAPQHPFPAAVEDACAAWVWAHAHAAALGGDPARMSVAGESAGANLASVIAVCSAWERPEPCARAVFDLDAPPVVALPACGILQVSEPERFKRRRLSLAYEVIANLEAGYLPRDRAGLDLSLADPVRVVEGAAPARRPPPFFLPVGTRDPLQRDSERMAEALRRHGAEAELRLYPGEIHAFHALLWRKQARECWKEMLRFLDDRVVVARSGHSAAS